MAAACGARPVTVFRQLDAEWDALVVTAAASDTLAAWGAADPALRFPSLCHLQLFVERRDLDPAEADRVLAALACRAPEDTLAARVLLQLLLPGCKALVRRYGGSDPEERAGTVVAAAWDRIRTYPIDRRPLRIAANVLLDVRQRVVRGFSRRPRPVSLDAIPHDAVLASSDPGDESDGAASLLAWGVRHGHLDHETARLIALTRLAGVQVSELARETGTDAQTLRRRRLRAEQRLRRALEAA